MVSFNLTTEYLTIVNGVSKYAITPAAKIIFLLIFDENISYEDPRPLQIDFCAKIHGIELETQVFYEQLQFVKKLPLLYAYM